VDPAVARRWFEKNEAFDREIAERFGTLHEEIVKRQHEDWLADARGRLAYVIVLDQFSRNMFRGSPRAFASDDQALAAAEEGIARGHDKTLSPDERSFLYMPLMHSEDPARQERSVALFQALAAEAATTGAERGALGLEYAEKHREVIARFGRFPQRNTPLGRTSTSDEWEYLKAGGGF
jgi:uncharacterized protein (DUF924 family)